MNQLQAEELIDIVSGVPGIAWPAIPNLRASQLLALQFQLERTQWLTAEEIERRQIRQLGMLLNHAYHAVPFYRDSLNSVGLTSEDIQSPDDWRRIPLLKRVDVQTESKRLHAKIAPKEHGQPGESTTSGSSGTPLSVTGTAVTRLFWNALTLRNHLWQQRDFRLKLATIRHFEGSQADKTQLFTRNWGSGTIGIVETGPACALSIREPTPEQADWLERHNPHYLLTYPSNLYALANYFETSGRQLTNLREIRSFGELLEPHVRAKCQAVWGVPVTDVYSSQEIGYIAIQCPEHEHYHVQSESVLVEVLNEQGEQCRPGEIGKVVVTLLHNFRMPLLRYDIGDFAEVGVPCPCGRGLPVLNRIVGRQRNMFRRPDGQQFWPTFEFDTDDPIRKMPPIRQFQVIQRSLEHLEAVLAVFRPLISEEEQQVAQLLIKSFGSSAESVGEYR